MSPEDAEEFLSAHGRSGEGWWRMTALGIRLGVPEALGIDRVEYGARLGGYFKLPIEERREAVAELTAEGMTQADIAAALGVSTPTISRDVSNETNKASDQGKHEPDLSNETPDVEAVEALLERAASVADLVESVKNERRPKPTPAPPAHPAAAFLWARLSEVRSLNAASATPDQRPDIVEAIEMWSKEIDRLHQEVAP